MWLDLAILVVALGAGPLQARYSFDAGPYEECTPSDSRTLKLDIAVDPTLIVPTRSQEVQPSAPHTSKVRVTLTNPGPTELRLAFPDPLFLGYRAETPDGTPLPQEDAKGSDWSSVRMTLAPGASESLDFRWTARSWDESGRFTPLPPGKYKLVGTLAERLCGRAGKEPPIETAPVTVEVRPAAN